MLVGITRYARVKCAARFGRSLALLWCVSSYRKALLGIFHLFRATELPYFWDLKSRLITLGGVSSWCSVVRIILDKAASYRRMSLILTAHDARYASVPRGTSTPNLPTGSSPKGEHGR